VELEFGSVIGGLEKAIIQGKIRSNTKGIANPYLPPNDSTLYFYGSGDGNGNNKIDSLDLVVIIKLANGTYSGPVDKRLRDRADVNGDGYVNLADVTLFENFLNGRIKYLPGYWDQLPTILERVDWLGRMVKIDKTYEKRFPGGDCTEFANQFWINFHGFQKEDLAKFLMAYPHDTIDNGRFNIPVIRVGITYYGSDGKLLYGPDGKPMGHDMNTVVVGDDAFLWHAYCNVEPQVGSLNVQPGQYFLNGANMLFDVGGLPITSAGGAVQMEWYVSYRIKDNIPTKTAYAPWRIKFINLRNP
jgi:hypothetical protein